MSSKDSKAAIVGKPNVSRSLSEEIRETAERMVYKMGKEKAMAEALSYADTYEKEIEDMEFYNPIKIDYKTKQRNFWWAVEMACRDCG